MAVVEVTDGTMQRGGDGSEGIYTFVRHLIVRTDNPSDGPKVVLAHSSIPRFRDGYAVGNDSDGGAMLKNISCTPRDGSRLLWDVTANYETFQGGLPKPEELEIPYLAPATYTWGSVITQKTIDRDIEGNLITNSAGEMPEPGPVIDDSHATLTVEKSVSSSRALVALTFVDCVNDGYFFGGQPGTWKCQGFQENGPQYSNGIEYFMLSMSFEHNPTLGRDKTPVGWDLYFVDAGFRQLISPNAPKKIANLINIEINSKPVTKPWPLDGRGTALNQAASDPVYRRYRVYQELDFSNAPVFSYF